VQEGCLKVFCCSAVPTRQARDTITACVGGKKSAHQLQGVAHPATHQGTPPAQQQQQLLQLGGSEWITCAPSPCALCVRELGCHQFEGGTW
jgi:hypothetical protein